ncbi:MAG: DHH family phosphoesterase [Ruminococcus sp.]
MRRKVWTLSPVFVIFSIVMFGMAGVTYYYNPTVSIIEMAVAIISSAIVVVLSVRFKKYISKTISNAISNITDLNQAYLERFKMPVVISGKFGDILWSNSRFKKQLCMGRNPINESINTFIGNKSIEDVADSDGFDIVFDGKQYTVYCTTASEGYICFYIDNTFYKETAKKYSDTRKSVALLVFDNLQEFTNDSEEEGARLILALETKLLHYANENKALFKALTSNKYMMIFDQVHLDMEISKKFPILKEIRSIKYNNREATISIGIGTGCDTLIESEQQARKALDMALGRGGDQVALLKDNNYEFFGGVSAGVERLSKVRTRVVAKSIARAISESDRVFIMGHRFSDLDCVGAAVGLQPIVEKGYKKHCRIVINKETSMAESLINLVDKEVFITPEDALKNISTRTLLIVVDTHIPDFVESKEVLDKSKRIIVIDHHRKMVNYISNSMIFYHEPTSSSASEMVAELITYLGENYLSNIQAKALLAGIMLDTKNFVLRTGVRTFESAAFLRKKGADTVKTKELFANSLETYKEKYKIVSNSEIIGNCAIAVCEEKFENIRLVSAQAADELLAVADVMASFVIFRNSEKEISISARSYGKLNVQVIMEKLGGGGHQNMAAAQLKNITINQAKNQLLEAIDSVKEDLSSDKGN